MKRLVKQFDKPPLLQEVEPLASSNEFVTVRIDLVGLCRTDLALANGKIPHEKPLVLGHEGAGHVVHDPSGCFRQGEPVAINPCLPNGDFIGLDSDGILQDFIHIPSRQLHRIENVGMEYAAYLEPVAASMAVLKARITREQRGVLFYQNRISHLTYIILKSHGFDIDWKPRVPDDGDMNTYDYVIETVFDSDSIPAMLNVVKPGGLLVVKSRTVEGCFLSPRLLVSKEITMQAVNYHDFDVAAGWIQKHSDLISPLLGETYDIEDWATAFEEAGKADSKKIFIRMS